MLGLGGERTAKRIDTCTQKCWRTGHQAGSSQAIDTCSRYEVVHDELILEHSIGKRAVNPVTQLQAKQCGRVKQLRLNVSGQWHTPVNERVPQRKGSPLQTGEDLMSQRIVKIVNVKWNVEFVW